MPDYVCPPTAGRIFLLALCANLAWELTQTPCYSTLPEWLPAKLAICFLATVADAGYATLVYCAGASLYKDRNWIGRFVARRAGLTAAVGLATAVAVEVVAQRFDIWHYSSAMPMIPLLSVGLLPALQLALISVGVFYWVGARLKDAGGLRSRLAENNTAAPTAKQTESALTAAPRSA